MLAENLLNKIGFTIEEQNHYWEIKSKIVKGLDVFAKSFMLGEITWEDALDKSHEMFKHKLHPYTIDLMFLLECTG